MIRPWQSIPAEPSIGRRLRNVAVAATLLSLIPIGVSQAGTVTTNRSAVAEYGQPGNMCVMALAQQGKLSVGSLTFNGTPQVCLAYDPDPDSACHSFTGTPCDIYNDSKASDSTNVTGNAEVAAAHYYLAGGLGSNSGTIINKQYMYQYQDTVPDPYSGLPQPPGSWSGSCNAPIDELTNSAVATAGAGLTVGQGQTVVLDAPDYGNSGTMWICGNVHVSSQGILILKPGTYVLAPGTGTSSSQNGDLTIDGGGMLLSCATNSHANPQSYPSGATCSQSNGTTIILTNGQITVNGNGGTSVMVNVTAPSSGPYTGVAFWVQGTDSTVTNKFNGGSQQVINGAIYIPNEQVVYSGGANGFTNCSQLVAMTVEFAGNPIFAHNCPANFVKDPAGQPRLIK